MLTKIGSWIAWVTVNTILESVYTRIYLSEHTLSGKGPRYTKEQKAALDELPGGMPKSKPGVPVDDVSAIVGIGRCDKFNRARNVRILGHSYFDKNYVSNYNFPLFFLKNDHAYLIVDLEPRFFQEREAASAWARSEFHNREQVKLKDAITERAANAKKAAEL